MNLKNNRGQGMIEYLILVAIISISAIGVVRIVGSNVSIQFANIAKALGSGGGPQIKAEKIDQKYFSKKDMSNFLHGAINNGVREDNDQN